MIKALLTKLFARESACSDADKGFISSISNVLGFKPNDLSLYTIALTHKSANCQRSKGKRIDNERLEYLGDSILDAIVADYLYSQFASCDEGFLTKMRSRIVSRASLNAIAIAIGLDSMVYLQPSNTIAQKNIFGDALEAFVGAIYLDKGFRVTKRWVENYLLKKHVDFKELLTTEVDYKSRIIEWAQKFHHSINFSTEELPKGREKIPTFECILSLGKRVLGSGFGSSKKEAEQNAAMVALERIDIVEPTEGHGINTGQIYSQN